MCSIFCFITTYCKKDMLIDSRIGALNPGSWQSYSSRPQNRKRTIMEIRNSYLTELYIYESYMSNLAINGVGNSAIQTEEQNNTNSNQSFSNGFSNGFQ